MNLQQVTEMKLLNLLIKKDYHQFLQVIFLEKGKELAKKWDNKEIKLITKINDCLNIENNIKNIIEINKNIENFKSKKINIKFSLIDNQIINLSETINQIGEVYNEEGEDLKFKFKAGTNYNISNNGLIATKHNGGDAWNCVIIGEKEIPKNRKKRANRSFGE